MLVLRSFHYVNWNRQDNTWPTSESLVDQQLVNWSSTRQYDYIYTLWSSLSPEEERKKGKREREKSLFFPSLSLSLVQLLNEGFIRFICCCAPSCALFFVLSIIDWTCVCMASECQIRNGSKYPWFCLWTNNESIQ